METYNNEISCIASGSKFSGDFATRSDLRIDGVFEGNLYCSGRLVVGESGVVKGTVIGNVIEFSGTMEGGSFFVKDYLSLKGGSVVNGDIFANGLQVDLRPLHMSRFSPRNAPVPNPLHLRKLPPLLWRSLWKLPLQRLILSRLLPRK